MNWQKVIFATDCVPCEFCLEPVCPVCSCHYAECDCPGPTQDDMYEYEVIDGVMMAREIENAE